MKSGRITPDTVFRVSESLVSCRSGEDTFVLEVDSGRYLGMDSLCTLIWEFMLQEPRSFGQICDYVLQEFDVSVEECQAGVLDMVEQLLENKIIEFDHSREC